MGIHGQNAIRWAKGHLDSTAYSTRCLAFVEDAIERANGLEIFGGDYAAESARRYDAASNSSAPPLGALVFYDTVGDLSSRDATRRPDVGESALLEAAAVGG